MPFARLLVPIIAGIIVSTFYQIFNINQLVVVVFSLALITGILFWFKKFSSYQFLWWYGLSSFFLFFFLAFLLTYSFDSRKSDLHISKINNYQLLLLKIDNAVIEKKNSLKTEASIQAFCKSKKWNKSSGRLLIYFEKDSISKKLKMGDEFIASVKIDSIAPPLNPGQFNYKRFLGFKNIHHQVYIKASKWKKVNWDNNFYWAELFYNLQQNLLGVINKYPFCEKEKAVVSALILGNRDEIDQDLMLAYSASGAMHVLSVSGLHVGLIYVIFAKFLIFLDRKKRFNILRCLLILFLLWFYAGVTGFSASVLRSTVMFSFIAIANATKRNTNIYNTLASSAFIILIIYPNMLFEVGFQLSYLAVIGIIYVQPKLYHLLYFKNYLFDQIWKITTISLAAQLATFPLGLLYFHQFPNYFLLSNFVVIPAAVVILYGGIFMIIFQYFDPVFYLIAKGVDIITQFLNYSVIFTEQLPYSLIQGIHISIFETYMVYAAILLFFIYFYLPKVKILFAFLLSIIFILTSQFMESVKQNHQEVLTVYHLKKDFAINFFSNRKNYLLANKEIINNEQNLRFNLYNNWFAHSVNNPIKIVADSAAKFVDGNLFINRNFVQFKDKAFLILNDNIALENFSKIDFDYVILTSHQRVDFFKLRNTIKFKEIIADANNKYYNIKKLEEQADSIGFPIYVVNKKGAFLKEFE
jgi:competence protein ComEC